MACKIIEMYISDTQRAYYTIINGEAIILMPKKDKTYALGPVGTRIWELADGTHKIKEVVNILCEEFEGDKDETSKDIINFVSDLHKKRILQVSKDKQTLIA